MRAKLFFILLLVFVSSAQAIELNCNYVDLIMQGFLKQHVIYNEYSANVERRLIDQYLKHLDGSKIYLYDSDIKLVRSKLKDIGKKIKTNHCEALFEVQDILSKRTIERAQFALDKLSKDFVFDKNGEIIVDPKYREYAKTKKQADDFQLKYMQFQMANFMAADIKMDESREMLKHRYERLIKSLGEQKKEDVFVNFLDSFAHALDPHSSYFSKEALEEFEIQMNLSLEGIGATLSSQDGYTLIEQLVPGGAAADSGQLKVQDKIIAVGQGEEGKMEPIIDMDLKDVVRKIRGKKGTVVRLTILRKGPEKTEHLDVSLVRKKIELEDEAAQISYVEKMVNGQKMNFAVLDLPSFYAGKSGERSAAKDLKILLEEARKKKVDGLILDLSNNGGGSLEDAVKIGGLFFKTGNVVETGHNRLADTDPKVDFNGPMVVLTSRISASASEIVAGALKDYKRAIILGADHTFGKGSVQSVLPLPAGLGAIKVTIGMFFIPGGNSTQHRGVEGDVFLPSVFAIDEIGEKSQDYSLPPKAVTPFISKDAFVSTGDDAWTPIDPSWISKLRSSSKKRILSNKDFAKIETDLKKAKEKIKVIKLADVLKDKTEAEEKRKKKNELTREDKKVEYLKKPEVEEAIDVLSDLVSLEGSKGKQLAVIGETKIDAKLVDAKNDPKTSAAKGP